MSLFVTRLKLQFDTNAGGLKLGEYLLEYGPSQHHIGFLVAYHLDRILGVRVQSFRYPPSYCN